MIRYKFGKERVIGVYDDAGSRRLKQILKSPTDDIFVDILGQNDYLWKVKVFMPNGEIVIGTVTKLLGGLLTIHNEEELYDGRFNSDRV